MSKKNLILLLAMMFLIASVAMPITGENAQIPKKALKLETQGDKATKNKEYDKALELYKEALVIHSEMETVHYKIAYILAVKKMYKEAIDELYVTLKINKDNENAKKLLINLSMKYGSSLLQTKKLADANSFFLKVSKIEGLKSLDEKFEIELNYWIGFTYFQLQNMELSNEYLQKFIDTTEVALNFPKFFSTANYLLGLNFSQANDVEKSNKYLSVFIDLNKDEQNKTYLAFAKYILGMNNFNVLKEKISDIEKNKNKTNIESSDKKIVDLATSETGIEENLLFALEHNPDIEDAYVLLGNYYYLKKDIENSIKYYKLLIEKFPGSADIEVYKVFLKDIEKRKQ